MNNDEKMNALRQALTLFFGLLSGLMPGLASSQQYSALTSAIVTAVPALMSIGSVIWSIYAHWNMKKVPENSTAIATKSPLPVGSTIPANLPAAVTKVVGALLISFVVMQLFAPPHAAAAVRHRHHAVASTVPVPAADPRPLYDATQPPAGKQLTSQQVEQNPLILLQNIATSDLTAALADAQAQTPPDAVAAQCYQALLNLKNNPAFALPSGQVVGAFTAIQKGRDLKTQLANLASPTGPLANLNAACAAWTQDNVATLIAIGGAVGLIANPAGASAAAAGAFAAFNAQILAFLAVLAPK